MDNYEDLVDEYSTIFNYFFDLKDKEDTYDNKELIKQQLKAMKKYLECLETRLLLSKVLSKGEVKND